MNILKTENLFWVFWKQVWTARNIQMNMHEQINIDDQFQFKLLASLPPVTVCGQWQEWKNRMKSMKNEYAR